MSVLDREKAREVATSIARGDYDTADDAVDAIVECLLPDPNEPYWNFRAEQDRVKLHQILELCLDSEDSAREMAQDSARSGRGPATFRAMLFADQVRAVLMSAPSGND